LPPATDPAGGERTSSGESDAFARLEARLEQASKTAERLISDAAAEAAGAAMRGGRPKPPPQGWQAPGDSEPDEQGDEIELLAELLSSAREIVPEDLRGRLSEAMRELLLAVRALIDWYLERLERGQTEPAEVEDIPVS
jgi:hypothetical protein